MTDTEQTPYDNAERERMASMLENWFQQRMELSNRAFKLMFIPLAAVVLASLLFWFNYYLPVPSMVLLGILLVSLLVWIVCLLMGAKLVKRVRTGDSLMLRKIRSSNSPE